MSEELEMENLETDDIALENPEEGTLAVNFEEGRTLKFSDFKNLILNPVKFFKSGIYLTKDAYLYPLLIVMGIAYAFERIDSMVLKNSFSDSPEMLYLFESWIGTWTILVIGGIFNAIIIWNIMGWWYNLRLKWCSYEEINKTSGRVVFVYNRLIFTVPVVLLIIIQTFMYNNYIEAFNSENIFLTVAPLLVIGLWIFSVINSYKSVTNLFDVKKGLAMLWFLILPLLFQGITIIALIATLILAAMY